MKLEMGRKVGCLLCVSTCTLVLSCGLVKAPFRVAGAVVDGAYVGGQKVAQSTSDAFEKRKLKKKKEEEEAAKKEMAAKPGTAQPQKTATPQGVLPPPDSIPVSQAPALPVDTQPLPPIEPLPLPQ